MISAEMLAAVDKADSAQFTRQDVLDPQGWELLAFLMDPRTGLGRFRDFRISNYQLMMALIDAVMHASSVDEILALPDVAERVELYTEQSERFVEQLHRVCTVRGDLVVVDLRGESPIHAGNRFSGDNVRCSAAVDRADVDAGAARRLQATLKTLLRR